MNFGRDQELKEVSSEFILLLLNETNQTFYDVMDDIITYNNRFCKYSYFKFGSITIILTRISFVFIFDNNIRYELCHKWPARAQWCVEAFYKKKNIDFQLDVFPRLTCEHQTLVMKHIDIFNRK